MGIPRTLEIKDGVLHINKDSFFLDGFKLIRILGEGANGVIIEAIDNLTKRTVAIKIWLPNRNRGTFKIEQYMEEVQKIAKFNINKIAQLYYAKRNNGFCYAIMEYVEGYTLEKWLQKNHTNFTMRHEILNQIIEVMELCHSNNIYHGDLHAKNILVQDDNKIKILDFGTSILSGKENSHKRESEKLFETGLKLMYEENKYKLLDIKNPKEYPPECIRIALKSLNRILTLIYIEAKGDIPLNELSVYITRAPFFNLNAIFEHVVKNSINESLESFIPLLLERLVYIGIVQPDRLAQGNSFTLNQIFDYYNMLKKQTINFYNNPEHNNYKKTPLEVSDDYMLNRPMFGFEEF